MTSIQLEGRQTGINNKKKYFKIDNWCEITRSFLAYLTFHTCLEDQQFRNHRDHNLVYKKKKN